MNIFKVLFQDIDVTLREAAEKKKDVWRKIPAAQIQSVEFVLLLDGSKGMVCFIDQGEKKREYADIIYSRKVTEAELLLQTNKLAKDQNPTLLLPLVNLLGG